MTIGSSYLRNILDTRRLKVVIRELLKVLRPKDNLFDTIVFRGLSGSMVAPIIALLMKKHMLAIRKGEKRHSYHDVEGYYKLKNYIIVDDLISEGHTLSAIYNEVRTIASDAKCVGIALYNHGYPGGASAKTTEIPNESDYIIPIARKKINNESAFVHTVYYKVMDYLDKQTVKTK